MRIILIGAGKIGYQIAGKLAQEAYNVVVIDRDLEVVNRIGETLDVLAVQANGLLKHPLEELGVNQDDIVIAATASDEGNMIACLSAKNLGAGKTIARIRNPEFTKDLAVSKEDVAVDYVINPEKSTANDITQLLTFSPAGQLGDFAGKKVQMVQLPVEEKGLLDGMAVWQFGEMTRVLVAAVSRNGRIIIPRGDDILRAGDDIFVTGKRDEITDFCVKLGLNATRPRNVMIIGGGRISHYLAENLHHHGVNVKIIESDPKNCRTLSELLPHALVILGDGTDAELLKAENIASMDAVVALTGRDEDNILVSLLAKQLGAGKGVAKVSRANYISLAEMIGVDAVVTPSIITAGEILRLIRGERVMSLFLLLGGQAEINEFLVKPDDPVVNKTLKEIELPKEVLVVAVVRGPKLITPRGDTTIQAGDRAIAIFKADAAAKVKTLFGSLERKRTHGLWSRLKSIGSIAGS